MSKQKTYSSFQDLDTERFRGADGNGALEKNPKTETRCASTTKNITSGSDSEDESALFLAAVAGNVDVSLNHSHDVPITRCLRSIKTKPDATRPAEGSTPEPAKPPEPPPPVPEEARLFANAMDGVRPIHARGRDLVPPSRPRPLRETASADMDAYLNGKLVFSLEHTDEFVQGYVQGFNPVVLGKLKAGTYSPEAHVDLHGKNIEQAYATLVSFVKHAYQDGKRHLIVVTGRGKNSPGGTPVLRERVQAWFTRDPFKRVVLGFCSAKPSDGGAGALYLLLRKRKKSQGKIVWDSKPSEEDLLL